MLIHKGDVMRGDFINYFPQLASIRLQSGCSRSDRTTAKLFELVVQFSKHGAVLPRFDLGSHERRSVLMQMGGVEKIDDLVQPKVGHRFFVFVS